MIKHEFIMTDDAIPIPVEQEGRRRLKVCENGKCNNVTPEFRKLCSPCHVYKSSTGHDRPERYFKKPVICQECFGPKQGRRFLCNSCWNKQYRKKRVLHEY